MPSEVKRRTVEPDATLSAMVDAVVVYGPGGEVSSMNRAAEELLGISEDRYTAETSPSGRAMLLRAETLEGIPYPPEELPVVRALRGETIRALPLVIHTHSGETRSVSINASPIKTRDGRLQGAVVTFRDMTEIHKLQLEQRRLLEAIIQVVSHDLRSPLTAVQGQAQLLQRMIARGMLPDRCERSAESIITGTKRMNAMIQDLVDSARLESGQLRLELQPVKLDFFVAELLERSTWAMDTGRVRSAVPPDLPMVCADPNRLDRILTNLVTNALKHSSPESEVLVSGSNSGGEVCLAITDRGPGIALQDLPRLFERPYWRDGAHAAEGLGPGLYTTRKLVEAQGGRIWVESEAGKGSSFKFALPALAGS